MVYILERYVKKYWGIALTRKISDQNWPQVGHFEFDQVNFFLMISTKVKITFVVAKITFKVVVITSIVALVTFVVVEMTLKWL